MRSDAANTYSLVVPVFNSGDNLSVIVNEFKALLLDGGYRAELIFTDDCSDEKTRAAAERLALEHPYVTSVFLKKNAGQLAATTCGIRQAKGNVIITLDDDLQYPMREVIKLITHYHQSGKKIVFGCPKKRMQGFRHKLLVQFVVWLFDYILLPRYRKINFYTSFRIFSRSLFHDEKNNAIPRHLFYLWEIPVGEMDSIPVEHVARKTGTSTYTFLKKTRVLLPVILFALYRTALLLSAAASVIVLLVLFFKCGLTALQIAGSVLITGLITALASRLLLGRAKTVKYEIHKIIRNQQEMFL